MILANKKKTKKPLVGFFEIPISPVRTQLDINPGPIIAYDKRFSFDPEVIGSFCIDGPFYLSLITFCSGSGGYC